jgi:Asp-tRNA(Asn)/Glu-tRNA(Gln) amidotransferase A subunit family amidase
MLTLSPHLDTVGVYGRTLRNVALIAEALMRYDEGDAGKEELNPRLRGLIERGRDVTAADYNSALERVGDYGDALNAIFQDYDAIVTPAAVGEAPAGLKSTGDSIFNRIWTLCGTPALNLPVLRGPNGLPIGLQLVLAKGGDAGLLGTARWPMRQLGE